MNSPSPGFDEIFAGVRVPFGEESWLNFRSQWNTRDKERCNGNCDIGQRGAGCNWLRRVSKLFQSLVFRSASVRLAIRRRLEFLVACARNLPATLVTLVSPAEFRSTPWPLWYLRSGSQYINHLDKTAPRQKFEASSTHCYLQWSTLMNLGTSMLLLPGKNGGLVVTPSWSQKYFKFSSLPLVHTTTLTFLPKRRSPFLHRLSLARLACPQLLPAGNILFKPIVWSNLLR